MRIRKSIMLVIASAILAAAFSMNVSAQNNKETVRIAGKPGSDSYLTDARGNPLYYYKNDLPGKSVCAGQCLHHWTLYCYTTEEISVADGLDKADFLYFVRPDGENQLTYKGAPLYTYKEDRNPGETKGHGLDDLWFLVRP